MQIKLIEVVQILVLVIMAIIANLLNDIEFCNSVYPIYNQMILISIAYICVSKIFGFYKMHHCGATVGQFVLLFLCASLYYSKSFIDYISFFICVCTTVTTIAYLGYESC